MFRLFWLAGTGSGWEGPAGPSLASLGPDAPLEEDAGGLEPSIPEVNRKTINHMSQLLYYTTTAFNIVFAVFIFDQFKLQKKQN